MHTRESMKPRGAWEARRTIKVPALAHAADEMAVERAVGMLPGVRRVAADLKRRQVVVLYDATQSSYQVIVETLESEGFPPSDSWWSRFKGNCYQYFDGNARDNATAPPPACCNKPPK